MDLAELTETIRKGLNGDEDILSLRYSGSDFIMPYVMAGRFEDDVFYGFFEIDGGKYEIPIGYTMGTESENENLLPIQLVLSGYKQELGSVMSERIVSGSTYPILGMKGNQGIRPVVILTESNGELGLQGMCYKDGEIVNYNFSNVIKLDLLKERLFPNLFQDQKEKISVAFMREDPENYGPTIVDWKDPRSIVDFLDRSMISQTQAKRMVSVAFSNYALQLENKTSDLPIYNVLSIGPSAVGKTLMFQLLAMRAKIPFVQMKLTSKSSSGLVGDNLTTALYEAISSRMEGKAPFGIVFLDELDKLTRGNGNDSTVNERLQDELVGWLEDGVIGVNGQKPIYTKNLLFVTAGAFLGASEYSGRLDSIIQRRLISNGIKFTEEENLLHRVEPEDLIEYGLKPELIGRLPVVATFDPLSHDDLVRILEESNISPLKEYKRLFQLRGSQLEIGPGVSEIIASYCPQETGARALRTLCAELFTEIIFNLDSYDNSGLVNITPELVKKIIKN